MSLAVSGISDIKNGGIFPRFFVYILCYLFLYIFIVATMPRGFANNFTDLPPLVNNWILLFLPLIPFIFIESRVRKFRRANGLSIWKNITEDLKQLEVDKRISMEQNATDKINGSEKDSIEYYFNLKEKGAISEDEYKTKKSKLLGQFG